MGQDIIEVIKMILFKNTKDGKDPYERIKETIKIGQKGK